MDEIYIGEIRIFPFAFAPRGWHLCDGATLIISSNMALYSLIGHYYGGTPGTDFKLPDLRGRTAIGAGLSFIGSAGGSETVALTPAQLPSHTHMFSVANETGTTTLGPANVLAQPVGFNAYNTNFGTPLAINSGTVVTAGSGVAHNNLQPFGVCNFCIALQGLYPPRN